MEQKIKVEMEVVIEDDDIDDIMVSALEGGINYWCWKAEVVGEYLGEWAHEQISRGGELKLYDIESDDTWILNKEKFLKGIEKFLLTEDGVESMFAQNESILIDPSMIDAGMADSIVQYALFGEIVFG